MAKHPYIEQWPYYSPFLKARNSKTLCTILTMIVRPRRYGLVSIRVCCYGREGGCMRGRI